MAATGRAVTRDLNRNTLKRKKLETHAKTFANALCYQKSHAYTDLIWPKWRWRVQYRKKLNQRASAVTAAIFDVIKSQRSLGKSILIFFALWALVARFPTNRRFFRQNGRISRSVLPGIYATNELNSTITTTEMRKLAKTKSLKLEQFFLAGFFAFIARPTLSYFIEKVMRSSLTLISKIVASSVAMHRRDLHFVGNTQIHCRGSLM